jgi:predicted metal-dependent hydrolase
MKVCISITKILLAINVLLCLFIFFVLYKIKETFEIEDPMIMELRNDLKTLFTVKENYKYSGNLETLNKRDIMKEINIKKGNKSYTINKKSINLCLLDENGKYYNKNNLMYVLLHEISHVICDEVGHTDKFYEIFDDVLKLAEERKIYDPKIPMIDTYCKV